MASSRSSLKITLDGHVHMVDVTKSTTCDDVIRKLLLASGRTSIQSWNYAVYKQSAGKEKMLDARARIIGPRRLLWKKSSYAFVVKKKTMSTIIEEDGNQTFASFADDSFSQSQSFARCSEDIDVSMTDQPYSTRRMSLPATMRFNKVSSKPSGNPEPRGFLCDLDVATKTDSTTRSQKKTGGHRKSTEFLQTRLVFNQTLKTRNKRACSEMDLTSTPASKVPRGSTQTVFNAPLHSTPTSSARSASRLSEVSTDHTSVTADQINDVKTALLKRFFANQGLLGGTRIGLKRSSVKESEYESDFDSSLCCSEGSFNVSILDKAFVDDDLDVTDRF